MTVRELRISARNLRTQPVFATVVIVSLALAIALNTTMYGVLDALSHPRLDMRDPSSLYWIRFYGDYHRRVDANARDAALASGMRSYQAITSSGSDYSSSAVLGRGRSYVEGGSRPVGANYFDVLGPRVLAGRTFVSSDARSPDAPVVITDVLASQLFSNGEDVVGGRIEIDRTSHVVIGVVSQQSNFPTERTMAWTVGLPAGPDMYVRLIRLRPDATRALAERELDLVAKRIALASGENPRDVAFRVHAAADPEYQVGRLHLALIFAVGGVLLVACANLANLQLARGIGRRRDLALRAAIGATRKHLIQHLLAESVLLAAAGLAMGLLLTYLAGRLLSATIPPSMGRFVVEPQLSWRVLAFAVVATVVCLVLVGLAPSVYVSGADPNTLLKAGAGTGATKHNRQRYGVLVAVEIALALALSSAAVLTVRAAIQASQTWYGFDSRPLVAGSVVRNNKPGVLRYSALLQDLSARLLLVNGVIDAAAMTYMGVENNALTIEDPGGVREFPVPHYGVTIVSPSYLRTMGLPIVAGRDFREGERDEGVVIIDEETARVLWPNANPIGAQIKLGDMKSARPYVRVIGVAGQQPGFEKPVVPGARMFGQRGLGTTYYLPGPSDSLVVDKGVVRTSFVARTRSNPELLAIAIRRASLGWADVFRGRATTMDRTLGLWESRQSTQFISSLFGLFAVLGVGLAAFGVYGVVAHSVAERRRELGVRIALGASARNILHSVLRESVVVALSGVAIGLLITKYAVRHLDRLVIEDDMFNAGLFAAVALGLTITAATAAMVPAMRATRVDPTESLRND